MLKNLLRIVLISSCLAFAAQAASFQFDEATERFFVNDAELGKVVVVTKTDFAPLITAKTDGENDGDGSFELRVFFDDTNKTTIDTASSEAGNSSTAILEVQTAEPATGFSFETQYARLKGVNDQNGTLTRLGLDTTSTDNGIVSENFKIKNLKSITDRETLVVFTVSNVNTLPDEFKFVLNLRSDTATIVGSIDGELEEETGLDDQFTEVVEKEAEAYNLLSIKPVCNKEVENGSELDVCKSAEAVQILIANTDDSIDRIRESRNAIKELGKSVKQALKDKEINRKEAKAILGDLSCAFKFDKKGIKRARKAANIAGRLGEIDSISSRQVDTIDAWMIRSNKSLANAYRLCKLKAADKLNEAGLISDTTRAKFPENIGDYEQD